ncbi:MAG: PAS domain S-box protein [Nitrospirae bacterium YQR-1]
MKHKHNNDDLQFAYNFLKERYDKLVKSVTGYVYTIEIDDIGNIHTTHGPGCETITGYTSQNYEDNPFLWVQMIHDDDKDIVLKNIDDIDKGHYIEPFEHRIIHKNGSIRWIRNTLISDCAKDKKIINHGIITDITERKQAEDKLRENYNFIKTVIDGVHSLIYAKDIDGRYILVNDALCKFLGKQRDDIIGRTVKDIFPFEDAQIMEEVDSDVFQNGIPHSFVIDIKHNDRTYTFLTNKTLYKDKDDNIKGIIGVSHDITLLKQKEEKEKSFLEEMKLLINNLPIGVAYIDRDFNILELNKYSCKVLELPEEGFINKKCYDLYGEYAHDTLKQGKDKICSYCKVTECLNDKKSITYESKYKNMYVRKTLIPEYDKNGEITRILEIVVDITDYLTKELLETIAQGITDEIMLIDNNYRILWANKSMLLNHSYKIDDLIGMCCYNAIHHRDSECNSPQHPCPLKDDHKNVIHEHIDKDGTKHYVEISLYPISNGHIKKYVHISKDITERVIAEETIKELNRTLEKRVLEELQKNREKEQMLVQKSKMATMGEMIGMVSHQWKQPLNALSLIIQDIGDVYKFGELTKEYMDNQLSTSIKQIKFMAKTIDGFRDFFKPLKTKIIFDVKSAIEELLSMFIQMFSSEYIDIRIEAKEGAITSAYGYPNEFKQVLLNILNNSKDAILAKRSSGNKIKGQIDINITNDDEREHIIIYINDNGGGIPVEIIDRIFDHYFTTKESEGTGIGLFISKTIIETRMGGSLTVSNIDGGAEFLINLNVHKTEIV